MVDNGDGVSNISRFTPLFVVLILSSLTYFTGILSNDLSVSRKCNDNNLDSDEIILIKKGGALVHRSIPPSINDSILFELREYQTVKHMESDTNKFNEIWYQVCFEGKSGWIPAKSANWFGNNGTE